MPKQTFCRKCYYRLPQSLRTRLYNRFGEGYEEAYAEAVKRLGNEDKANLLNP
jgi:hypothetical protein